MAYCAHCGKDISPQARACPQCGHPTGAVAVSTAPPDGFAIASLATAIGGFTLLPLAGSILAIVFGSIAKRRIARDPSLEGLAMARAGIILGWVGVAFGIVALAMLLWWISFPLWTFRGW